MKRLKTSAKQIENLAKATEKQVASLAPVLNGMRRVLLAVAERAMEQSRTSRPTTQDAADLLLDAIQYLQVDHVKYKELYDRLQMTSHSDIANHNHRYSKGIKHEPAVRYISDAAAWAIGMMSSPGDVDRGKDWSIASMSFTASNLREFLWNARAAWAFAKNTWDYKDESAYTEDATVAAEKAIHKIFVDGVNEDLTRVSNPGPQSDADPGRWLSWHTVGSDSAYIELLQLPADLRGQGLGRKVYDQWEASLPKRIKIVRLHAADTGSGDSSGFWEKMGFDWRYDFGEHLSVSDPRYEASREMVKGIHGRKTPRSVVIDE